MPNDPDKPNSNYSKVRVKGPRGRGANISIILAIFIVSSVATDSVGASRAKSWVISTMWVFPNGSLEVCEGEVVRFRVWIDRNEGSWTQVPYIGGSFTYPPSSFQANSSNINAGYVTPGSASTSLLPNTIKNQANFSFKAKKKGSATIKFKDNGGPDRPTASDVNVTIDVKECNYRLVAISMWTLEDLYLKPIFTNILDAELISDQDGVIGPLTVSVDNSDHHTQAMPFCGTSIDGANSLATITGSRNIQDNKLNLKIEYDVVEGDVKFTCQLPRGILSAGYEGTGQALVIDKHDITINTNLGVSGMYVPHEVRVATTVSGFSGIIIIPIYLP